MKKLYKSIITLSLALIMAALLPVQVLADAPDYISEIKIGSGTSEKEALKGLEGYTVLKSGNNYVDLNQDSNGGVGSYSDTIVYLGYKTTSKREEAITDLAVMNMKGGYDVNEYDTLMDKQLKSQIIPFITNFLTAINEYRENYASKNANNKKRAKFTHDMLNYYIDDDTGKKLGDLLLNKTKFEMDDDAYNKLTDAEKKEHADILTIFAQANGKATLAIENLITRGSDTSKTTWIERFKNTTYEDLVNATGKSPTDARKEVTKKYDDGAAEILDKWDIFRDELLQYDSALENVDNFDEDEIDDIADRFDDLDKTSSQEETEKLNKDFQSAADNLAKATDDARLVKAYKELKKIKYNGKTMLDFFLQKKEIIEEDITVLYPLVASLSDGQKAGLEFVSLKDLVIIAATVNSDYDKVDMSLMKEVSVYAGVDRAIYEKGGVALTSDSLRNKALLESQNPKDKSVGALSISLLVIASIAITGALATGIAAATYKIRSLLLSRSDANFYIFSSNSALIGKLAKGFGFAAIVMTIISLVVTYSDLKKYYKTEFSPIPHYMVDEKDLIGYNKKGEKIILKNQAAYYKAVLCNREKGDFKYSEIGDVADLNGETGQQWLALYAANNELENPILASSLKAEIKSDSVPSGYTKGIHKFGSDAVFNLNAYPYVWNKNAPKIQIYFKTDDKKANITATNFTNGAVALICCAGFVSGYIICALTLIIKKRINSKSVTA